MSSSSVCLYYMRGSCRFGNRCWNSHDLRSVRTDRQHHMDEAADTSDEEVNFVVGTRRGTTPMTASPSSSASKPRQRNPVLPNSANESSETNETASSVSKDNWCLKNINIGETKEGSPDSVLVGTVKKLNETDNLAISLCQQPRVKNEGDNFSWVEYQMEQCLESDLQCNICFEMFIKPTVLNCSHTFCHECIESWTQKVNHCPTCRVYVKNKSYCLTLDNFLSKIADCLPDEVKTIWETLKVERENNRAEVNRSQGNNAWRRNRRNHSMSPTQDVLLGERDREGVQWNNAPEEALFNPIRSGDVIGRNRDDWDDGLSDSTLNSYEEPCSYCFEMGHYASSCPRRAMENTDDISYEEPCSYCFEMGHYASSCPRRAMENTDDISYEEPCSYCFEMGHYASSCPRRAMENTDDISYEEPCSYCFEMGHYASSCPRRAMENTDDISYEEPCSYCFEMGHYASSCPRRAMENTDDISYEEPCSYCFEMGHYASSCPRRAMENTDDISYDDLCSYCFEMGHYASSCPRALMENTDDIQ